MVKYIVKVQDADGNFIGEFEAFKNLTFGKRLNNYGTASLMVPVNSGKAASLIAIRRFTLWIYRDDGQTQQLVWAGEQALKDGQLNANANNWVTVHCYDWLEQLNSRFTDSLRTFDQVDAGEIAWTLIDETQDQTNGNFGITQGEIEPTTLRDRQYYNQNIMEAIINLANVLSGFDFEITNQRVFNVRETMGTDKTDDILLEYGTNIASVHIIEDGVGLTNRAIVLGEAIDATALTRVERNDADLQLLYKVRESRLTEMDVSEIETLEDKGDAVIRKYGTPLLKLDLDLTKAAVPNIAQLSLGDLIRVRIKSGIYDIDETLRVFEWRIDYDVQDTEKLSLILGDFTL